MLFEDYLRTNDSRKVHTQSDYDFLNLSSWETVTYVREKVIDWYKNSTGSIDWEKRFKSKDNQEHKGAFFELFCHELLVKSGYKVKTHSKQVNNTSKVPDFEAIKGSEIKFYLECTLANAPKHSLSIEKLQNEIVEVVENIDSPNFFINIDFAKTGVHTISRTKFKKFIDEIITNLPDHNIINNKDGYHWTYIEKNWEINISFLQKSQQMRDKGIKRSLGILSYGSARIIDSTQPLLNSLKQKRASKYGILECPFIIAINTSDYYLQDIDIMQSLFGAQFFSDNGFSLSSIDTGFSSFFIKNNRIQNTGVSAILIARDLSPWRLDNSPIDLWHNPFAKNKLDLSSLEVPQNIFEKENDSFVRKKINGRKSSEIIGIDIHYKDTDIKARSKQL